MKNFLLIVLLYLSNAFGASFVFVIPSYNNASRYERNLDSVFAQTSDNYRVIYIDDRSLDETGQLVQNYIEKRGQAHRVTLIRNKTRIGALANIYQAVWMCKPEEIIVNLDGDDWLAHPEVITLLNQVYADKNVWLTYGKWRFFPGDGVPDVIEISPEVIQQNNFRMIKGSGTTPLRTFYAGLFQKIKKDDLMYEGEFFDAAYDIAIMLPMLEMAGTHVKFVSEVCYVYDTATFLNDHTLRKNEQLFIDDYVRKKEKYQPLEQLFP